MGLMPSNKSVLVFGDSCASFQVTVTSSSFLFCIKVLVANLAVFENVTAVVM